MSDYKNIKYLVFLLLIVGCNQNPVPDEQRELFREKSKLRKPVKISPEQILTKAFEEARMDLKDTTVTTYLWKEFYVKPADSVLIELWDAYEYAAENNVEASDNVQLQDDQIIYTKPVIRNDTLREMKVAFLPKKDIVLKLSN